MGRPFQEPPHFFTPPIPELSDQCLSALPLDLFALLGVVPV